MSINCSIFAVQKKKEYKLNKKSTTSLEELTEKYSELPHLKLEASFLNYIKIMINQKFNKSTIFCIDDIDNAKFIVWYNEFTKKWYVNEANNLPGSECDLNRNLIKLLNDWNISKQHFNRFQLLSFSNIKKLGFDFTWFPRIVNDVQYINLKVLYYKKRIVDV